MVSKRLKIYIAGPYQAHNCSLHDATRITQKNVDRVIEIANILIEKGHYPFVPHLSHYIHIHESCRRDYYEWWYDYDNTFLYDWAEALLYVAPSKGADAELQLAKELGLKIFHSVDEVPDAK